MVFVYETKREFVASVVVFVVTKSKELKIIVLYSGVNQWRCYCSLGTGYFLLAANRLSDCGKEGGINTV